VNKNSLDGGKLRGRVDALLKAERVLNRFFVFLADPCGVHNCGFRAVSRSLSAPVGWATLTQVVAPGMVGVSSLKREEVILHLVDDAIRDLALTAPTPTAQEHRSVACLTCPD